MGAEIRRARAALVCALLVAATAAVLPASSSAQTVGDAYHGSVVRRSNGSPVVGAKVIIATADRTPVASTTTDRNGQYILSAIGSHLFIGAVDQAGQFSPVKPAVAGVSDTLTVNDPTTQQTKVFGNVAGLRVLYVTDRAPAADADPYGATRSKPWGTSFGSFMTLIPRDSDACPGGWSCSVTKSATSPLSEPGTGSQSLSSLLRAEMSARHSARILVFVHGFNVRFEDALQAATQVSYNAAAGGVPLNDVPVVFSWPSLGQVGLYVADANNAELAYAHLIATLQTAVQVAGPGNVDVVAHSMGNQVLYEALRDILNRRLSLRLGHVFMAAPDVDSQLFDNIAPQLHTVVSSLTVYTSRYDEALKASTCLHGRFTRLGVPGSVPPYQSVEVVDVSNVKTSGLGHSYITDAPLIAQDIARTILAKPRGYIAGSGSQRHLGDKDQNAGALDLNLLSDRVCSTYLQASSGLQWILTHLP